jgi:hypothetical protein
VIAVYFGAVAIKNTRYTVIAMLLADLVGIITSIALAYLFFNCINIKAYIQTDQNGEFYNVNAFIAYEGFKNFGFEIQKFTNADEITETNPNILS